MTDDDLRDHLRAAFREAVEQRSRADGAIEDAACWRKEAEIVGDRAAAAEARVAELERERDRYKDELTESVSMAGEDRMKAVEAVKAREAAEARVAELEEALRESLVVLAALKHGDVPERHAPDVWQGILKAHDLCLAALAGEDAHETTHETKDV